MTRVEGQLSSTTPRYRHPRPSSFGAGRRSPLLCVGLVLAALGAAACTESSGVLGSSEQPVTSSRVFQRGTFGTVADTYVSASAMRRSFGSEKKLLVSAKHEALVRFDLASIPANAVIDSATLTVSVNGGDEEDDDDGDDGDHEGHVIAPIKLHRATAAWNEQSVTYTSFGQRFDPAIAGVLMLTNRSSTKSVAVTALVQGWVTGTWPNHGVVFTTRGRQHTLFASSEYNHVGQRPKLSVTYTVPDNHCAPNLCEHGGVCSNQVNGFTCACAAGYQGDRCELEIDDCASNPCQHGTCSDLGLSYTCACSAGYTGGNCQTDIDECAAQPCQNSGTCTQGVASYTCACPAGFDGAQCQIDINDCAGDPCQNGGTCHDLVHGYTCGCAAGYEGANCETNHNDCPANACVHGTCEDGLGAFTCACEPGYDGPACGHDIVDCVPGACANAGTCIEGVTSYTCACAAGYSGARCETDIDDCTATACHNGGLCVDGVNSFTCACTAGFSGAACDTSIDNIPAPANCTAAGSTSVSVMNGLSMVTVVLANAANQPLATGGHGVTVAFTGPVSVSSNVVDNHDGTYTISYQTVIAGTYSMDIRVDGASIAGSPFSVVARIEPNAGQSSITGPGLIRGYVGVLSAFAINTVDVVGTPLGVGGFASRFTVSIIGPAGAVPSTTTDNHNGTYTVLYVAAVVGNHQISVLYDGQHVTFSPRVAFQRLAPDPSLCIASGTGLHEAVAGVQAVFVVTAKSADGVVRVDGGDAVSAEAVGPTSFFADVYDNNDGTYLVTYTAPVPGNYVLSVVVNLGNIANSPFALEVL
jgi:Filamin/ABP280 repeat/EGF-like domain/Human growth factor-like EGF